MEAMKLEVERLEERIAPWFVGGIALQGDPAHEPGGDPLLQPFHFELHRFHLSTISFRDVLLLPRAPSAPYAHKYGKSAPGGGHSQVGNSLSWAAGNSLLSWGLDAALGAKSDRFCPGARPGAPSGTINVPGSGPDVRAWGQSRSQSKVSRGAGNGSEKGQSPNRSCSGGGLHLGPPVAPSGDR